MKEVFRKITAFALSLVVLLSTLSFTVDRHYCFDILIDVAVFAQAESCEMDIAPKNEQQPLVSRASCCSDETITVKGQDLVKNTIEAAGDEQKMVTYPLYHYLAGTYEDPERHPIPFQNYSPPLLVEDLALLDQVFLI